jgi:hypothetical protein
MYPRDYLDDGIPHTIMSRTTVTLSATVFNATSNQTLQGFRVWFYWYADNDTMGVVGSDLTDGEGVASVTWPYPESGVFVFWACVSTARQIMSSPVTLAVGKETELSMNVELGEGFNHVVSGRLLCDGVGVADEQVVIRVNGTVVDVVTTAEDGGYSTTLNLQPVDNEPTSYQVEAFYYGDDALNLTRLATLPDSTEYAVCTTLQYFGYKPASNTAILTVEPQSTQVMTQTKTPEELQQEAEDSGWLTTWHEWSWWYPWYRLHIKININPVIDIGFNPILPGGETYQWEGLEIFAEVLEEVWQDIMLDFIGVFISYIVAKGFSIWNLAAGLIAEGVKGAVQYTFLALSWNDLEKMLAISIANFLMGFIALVAHVGEAFVKALINIICAPAWSAMMLTTNGMIALAAPLQVVRTPVDYIESVFIDFPIAILALLRYLGKI